jgi:hypothetical protein
MKRIYYSALAIALTTFLFASYSYSVVYKWVDQNGQTHITDYPNPNPPKKEAAKPVSPIKEQAAPEIREEKVELKLSRQAYDPDEQIILDYSGLPGNRQDWITAVKSSAPENTYGEWFYTEGQKKGSHMFKGLPSGEYEVRLYFNWPEGGYDVKARAAFSVKPKAQETAAAPAKPEFPPIAITPEFTFPKDMPKFPSPKEIPSMPGAGIVGMFLAGFMTIVIIIGIAVYAFFSLCLFFIAKKAGVSAAWTAWIPIVNIWTFVASAGKSWWWILLLLIPIVNYVIVVYLWMCISENLGRNKWLGLLMLLPLINIGFMAVLAFSKVEATAPSFETAPGGGDWPDEGTNSRQG